MKNKEMSDRCGSYSISTDLLLSGKRLGDCLKFCGLRPEVGVL